MLIKVNYFNKNPCVAFDSFRFAFAFIGRYECRECAEELCQAELGIRYGLKEFFRLTHSYTHCVLHFSTLSM